MRNGRMVRALVLLVCGAVMAAGQTGGPGTDGGFGAGRDDPLDDLRRQGGGLPFEQGLILSGKVVLDGGGAPPEPVALFMDCGGTRELKGHTSVKGAFSIDLSFRNQAGFGDASVSQPLSDRPAANTDPTPFSGTDDSLAAPSSGLKRINLFGCRLETDLAGYASDGVELGNVSSSGSTNVGMILLRRREGVEGSAISATTLAAPKKARKAYEKAFKELRRQAPDREKARAQLLGAVGEYPEFAAAWNMLGRVRLDTGDRGGAYESFEKALRADSKYLAPYTPLLQMAIEDQRWDDAIYLSERILSLNPYDAGAQYFRAVAQFNKGEMDAAEASVRAMQSGDGESGFPHAHHLLGTILAQKGEYEPAAVALRKYLEALPSSPLAATVREQLTQWEQAGAIKASNVAEPQSP